MLVGSLGLTGVLVLSAVVLALLFAGGLYLFRLKFGIRSVRLTAATR